MTPVNVTDLISACCWIVTAVILAAAILIGMKIYYKRYGK